jgi:hypothetical protein
VRSTFHDAPHYTKKLNELSSFQQNRTDHPSRVVKDAWSGCPGTWWKQRYLLWRRYNGASSWPRTAHHVKWRGTLTRCAVRDVWNVACTLAFKYVSLLRGHENSVITGTKLACWLCRLTGTAGFSLRAICAWGSSSSCLFGHSPSRLVVLRQRIIRESNAWGLTF